MTYRQGKPSITMRPDYDSGGAVGVIKRIWRDISNLGDEVKNIGYDLDAVEAAASDFQVVEVLAADTIIEGRAVTAGGRMASADVPSDAGRVLGVAASSASPGQLFTVVTRGLASLSSFTQGDILYLGANGQLTTAIPESGFQQRIGLAIDAARVVVLLSEPIILV